MKAEFLLEWFRRCLGSRPGETPKSICVRAPFPPRGLQKAAVLVSSLAPNRTKPTSGEGKNRGPPPSLKTQNTSCSGRRALGGFGFLHVDLGRPVGHQLTEAAPEGGQQAT